MPSVSSEANDKKMGNSENSPSYRIVAKQGIVPLTVHLKNGSVTLRLKPGAYTFYVF